MQRILPIAALCALIAASQWQLLFTNQYTILESPDASYQALPWFQFAASQLRDGEFPLWERHLWAGQPLAGQVQASVFSPLSLALYAMPLGDDGYVRARLVHVFYYLLHLFAAIGAYRLARELGASSTAGVLAGVVYSLGGYVGNVHWLNLLQSTVFVPFVLLYLFRLLDPAAPVRDAIGAGLFLGLSWLSGHHNIPVLLCLTAAGFGLTALARNPAQWPRISIRFAAALALGFAIGAVQILPAIEYGREAIRWLGPDGSVRWNDIVPYSNHKLLSLQPRGLLGFALPVEHHTYTPYVGPSVLLLAALGLWLWRGAAAGAVVTVALISLLYALGGYTIFHGVAYSFVPFVEKARWPGTAIVLTHAAIAVAAAWGFDCARSGEHRIEIRRAAVAALCAATAWFVFQSAVVVIHGPQHFIAENLPLAFALLALTALAIHRRLGAQISANALAVALIGFAVVDLGTVGAKHYIGPNDPRAKFYKPLRENEDLVQALRERAGSSRVEVDPQAIPYNFGDWHGFDTTGGYLPSLTANSVLVDWNSRAAKRMLAVRYLVGKSNPDALPEVWSSPRGTKIFEDAGALPRAWLATSVVVEPDPAKVSQWLNSRPEDLRRAFVGPEVKADATCAAPLDAVAVKTLKSNTVTLEVESPCQGVLVLADTDFPGWTAEVDGREVRIHPVNFRFRGVEVGPGHHAVTFRYRPASVLYGAVLALLGGGLAAAVLGKKVRAYFPASLSEPVLH